jgi:phosphoglycolate phosphatase
MRLCNTGRESPGRNWRLLKEGRLIDGSPRLFLFDIDGTILRGGATVHRDAFSHAFRTVYDRPLTLDTVVAAGRTDTWLLVEPLRRSGVPALEIWEGMAHAFSIMEDYVDEHIADMRGSVLPGVREVLSRLQRTGYMLGLLTGNLSRIARAKMQAADLGEYFLTGGFGEESMNRADLVPVALAHAANTFGVPVNPGEAILIGDTPLDVEAAQAHGALACGVATGRFSVDELRASGAHLVLESLADHEHAVAQLLRVSR